MVRLLETVRQKVARNSIIAAFEPINSMKQSKMEGRKTLFLDVTALFANVGHSSGQYKGPICTGFVWMASVYSTPQREKNNC